MYIPPPYILIPVSTKLPDHIFDVTDTESTSVNIVLPLFSDSFNISDYVKMNQGKLSASTKTE